MVHLPDARGLSPESLELLRRIVVRAVIDQGMSQRAVAEMAGVSENTVGLWCAAYRENGNESFKVQTQGRPEGAGRALDPQQEEEVQKKIRDSTPGDHGIASAAWTRKAVVALVVKLYEIELTPQAMGKYLRRWNMTPQKPARHAREQDPEEVEEFEDEILPDALERAEEENAQLHFTDETGAKVDDQIGASYSPEGTTPVLEVPKTRIEQNVISSVSDEGELQYWIFSGTMNSEKFITFLEQLVACSDQKIYLFADRHPAHTSQSVDVWLEEHCSEIEVVWLPRHSPEHNPVEFLNNDLKQNLKNEPMPKDTPKFRETLTKILDHIATLPDRVNGYIQKSKTNLASAT